MYISIYAQLNYEIRRALDRSHLLSQLGVFASHAVGQLVVSCRAHLHLAQLGAQSTPLRVRIPQLAPGVVQVAAALQPGRLHVT